MTESNEKIAEVAKLFFKLGCIGFGGPAVHIAMMENEVVKKRKWMTHDHFLDLIGATNLIPGPNSTEMTMHCGQDRAGIKGMIVAGVCFIFPAVVITSLFAWMYQLYGSIPEVKPFLYGIKPAIIAIIVNAMVTLGKTAVKSIELGIIGLLTAFACIVGVNEIAALFGAGFIGVVYFYLKKYRSMTNVFLPLSLIPAVNSRVILSESAIFVVFLKIGAILYGSGYVLFAFLDTELVQHGLLTRSELIDAIAVGQMTPGPVFSAATFIGWQINGVWGAIAATVGIFLPSFIFVGLLNPLIPKLRSSKALSSFLDAINVASIAVILSVVVVMSRESVTDWKTVLIAASGFIVTFFFTSVNSAFIVLGGMVMGYLLYTF